MDKQIKYSTKDGFLHLDNIPKGIIIQIFDEQGELCEQLESKKSSEKIKITKAGTYLVILQMVNKTLVYKIKSE